MDLDMTARKRAAAAAALKFVEADSYVGLGSGTTVALFVEELVASDIYLKGVVAASSMTGELLQDAGIPLVDLASVGRVPVYVDGADEADAALRLIKGSGGAFAREKIIACSSDTFVCIADESKLVERLGASLLAVEVIPMARIHVARVITRLGGEARLRDECVTDNGNMILDVTGLDMSHPEEMEHTLDGIAGVVANGLFARCRPDVLLVGTPDGVERFERPRSSSGKGMG